ncbi:hypothetical protein L6E12_31120 [Actinokineospora sp. PR83]|uniref:hypothetical protein n=1 Tax=Actinokineospora sp. PR83 TaxID=2884908 RepID=UPI001F3CA46C|nr:hypothetical protein [Actinokineospora sp. PR83]MCG8920230.1 hypothetical protein [Actinokineospora sp. PR83]
MAAQAPAALLVSALVGNLAELVSGEVVFGVPSPGGLVVAVSWPPRPPGTPLGADFAEVATAPGVSAAEPAPGGGVVLMTKSGRVTGTDRSALRETATWLGLATRLDRLRTARDLAARRAEGLGADLAATRERLAQVRDLERRRLVGAITAVTTREFADVRARAEELGSAFAADAADTTAEAGGETAETGARATKPGSGSAETVDRAEEPGSDTAETGVGKAEADDDAAGAVDNPAGRAVADAAGRAVDGLRDALDELIDTFRTVVRGVHPAMLPERGPRAALEELAATLPRPVRFGGDLGRRVGWEVESGLYHAAAAVLTVLAGRDADTPVAVDLDRQGTVLRVVATAAEPDRPVSALAAALADDTERLAVLGGALTCAAAGGVATVSVRLPERIGADAVNGETTTAGLLDRVRDLLEQGWQAATDPADRDRWAAIADRLGRPVRLAVVGPARTAVVGALLGTEVAAADNPTWYARGESGVTTNANGHRVVRLPADFLRGLTVVDVPGAPDTALAAALSAESEGAAPAVDAVLCLTPPEPGFRETLRAGRQRVALIDPDPDLRPGLALVAATLREEEHRALRSAAPDPVALARVPPPDLPTAVATARAVAEQGAAALMSALAQRSGLTALRRGLTDALLARAEVITARRALVAVDAALPALPANHPLRWSVEQVRVEAHDIAELDLLDDITRGVVPLRADRAAALRLLGAHGLAARTRLGLSADAPADRVHAAAQAAADRWRAHAEHPATGARARHACEVLIRTCEGLTAQAHPTPRSRGSAPV